MRRRDFLRATGSAAGVAAASSAAVGTAAAQQGEIDSWLSNTDNYDGSVADATGQGEVTITVGAQGNGGAFAFDPPAVHVDTGTTVIWEWNGEGGQHNVHAQSGGEFESDLTAEAGFTFEHTFEESGIVTYQCDPHEALGMKGVVAVGDVDLGGGGGGGEGGEGGEGGGGGGGEVDLHELGVPIQAHFVGIAANLGIIVSLIFTFFVLKYAASPNTGYPREGR